MKKIRNTNSKILFALSLMFATSALGLISFGTMCAFQNKEQESFQYQTDIKPLTSYFDGGNGTSPENAYIISTEETFINFQKLVQLGCFTYNTYFKLGADITFSDNTVLDPIGTENCPFNSQFDGMGHTLSKLKVSSVNHEDVGVFGYVGSGGYIKNIKLDTPSITSTGPSTKTPNPLEGTVPSSSVEAPAYINETSINMESKPVNNYTVYYRSANKGILTDDGVLQTANIKTNNKFAIHVDAIITTSILINNEPMVVTYVADRFAVYIEGKKILSTDGVVSLFDRTTVNGKLTTKDPHYYEDQNGERILDQVTFVGFVAGHLDGEAEYVGVYNGTITANTRQTISHSSLIGKHKDDDLLNSLTNNYYYQDINFSEIIETKPSLSNVGYVNSQNFSASTGVGHDTDYTTIFNSNSDALLEDIGIKIPDAFRIYNGFGVSQKDSVHVKMVDEETGVIPDEIYDLEGIYLQEDFEHSVKWKKVHYSALWGIIQGDFHTCQNYTMSNALWLWTNKDNLIYDNVISNILQGLFGSSETVYLTLKISYSVSDCVAAKDATFTLYQSSFSTNPVPGNSVSGTGEANVAQFARSSNFTRNLDPNGDGDESDQVWTFNDFNSNISDVETLDENGNPVMVPFDPLICSSTSNSNVVQSKTISVEAQTKSNTGIFADTSTYSPLFGLGLKGINGTGARMDIFRVEILISHDQGNFSYSLNKVDFLYNLNATYDSSAATWTGWAKKESGVKIYFILQDLGENDTNLSNGIKIVYTRSSGYGYKVTATYYNQVNADASYVPNNTNGTQKATITRGGNI